MLDYEKLSFPNPQKIRKNWKDLNGKWDFYFDKDESANRHEPLPSERFDQEIVVPYSYTFEKSGIEESTYYPVVWYRLKFEAEKKAGKRYVLNFEAVDYRSDIWLNGVHVASHQGGHVPFEIDVTDELKAVNELQVRVEDYNEPAQPLGKQSWKQSNFLCWYTRTIGIWQNVWLEETGEVYLTNHQIKPNIHEAELEIDAMINRDVPASLIVEVSYQGQTITKASTMFKNRRAKFSVDVSSDLANFRLFFWHPDSPELYDVTYRVEYAGEVTDDITGYFGMRDIEARNNKVYLNDQEFYQKLILNQGYYHDGGMTGTTEEMLDDLLKVKEMGFNGIRMHQKIENHKLLYMCDALGLVMWAEMPSFFEFSNEAVENVFEEIPGFVQKHINHPSVIAYVVMNESWGVNEISHNEEEQHLVNALYYKVKSLDRTRLVIGNDGWEQTLTDISTIHDYNSNEETMAQSYEDKTDAFETSPSKTSGRKMFCDGYVNEDVPFMVSEYGGVAYQEEEVEAAWGYGERIASKEEVIDKIAALTEVVMDIPYGVGFCYTQLTDVEQEVNGLLNHRHEYKFDPAVIRSILESKRQYGFIFK
ncbi:glycoside hydrolase family 2 protein [Atopococcus tabaci]|uniref:glycoside hydrolase family 2 protein n=1 Tax=Atopococcus tabaci TaxID=269774 RepID=UPI0004049A75|nr:glycoside hydrolase family 2 [Atopococcus tabaci]